MADTFADLYDFDDEYDDYDPDDEYGVKEEPNCYSCADSGYVAGRWWRRADRPCPACHQADWLDRLGGWVWRIRHAVWRLCHRKEREELPF